MERGEESPANPGSAGDPSLSFAAPRLRQLGMTGLPLRNIDPINLPFDTNRNPSRGNDERLLVIRSAFAPRVLVAEAVLEEPRGELIPGEILEILGDEIAEDAARGPALDVSNVAIERRRLLVEPVEFTVDLRLQREDESRRQLRQPRLCGLAVGGGEPAIEVLEDAVIEASLVARVQLQLAVGILDVDHVEDVFEQELLRAFAEILELSRRDVPERCREVLAKRGVFDESIEGPVGAGAGDELELA